VIDWLIDLLPRKLQWVIGALLVLLLAVLGILYLSYRA